MAFIASFPSFKLNPSLIYQNNNNPQTKTLCPKPKLPIFKNTISKRVIITSKSPISISNKRTVLEAAEIPILILDSESDSHKIWWSNVVVKKPKNVFAKRKWNSIDVGNLCLLIGLHALALFAPFTFSWGAVTVAVVLYLLTGCLGVTLSYHRNLAHKSFKLPKWLEYIFAYCGVLALQVPYYSPVLNFHPFTRVV